MRFIDEKGRLFGLVNLLDLVILLFAGFLVFSFVANRMIISQAVKNQPARSAGGEEVVLKVVYYGQANEVANNKNILMPGDKDIFGKAIIEKVLEIRPAGEGTSNITVLVKTRCMKADRQYYYTNAPVKLNAPFTFSAASYMLKDGTIVEMRTQG